MNTTLVSNSSEVPTRPLRNKTPLKVKVMKSPHQSGDSSRQSSEMSRIEEADSPDTEIEMTNKSTAIDCKNTTLDCKKTTDKKLVERQKAIEINDKPEPERQDSGDTLIDVKITGEHFENSDETLVDHNEIKEASAKADDDAFANIETIPETNETQPEVDQSHDNAGDKTTQREEKWSRSKSYAHACSIDQPIDTLNQGC